MINPPSGPTVVYAEEWKRELFKGDDEYKRSDLLHLFLPRDIIILAMKV